MKNKMNTSLSLRKVLLSALVAAPLATLPAPLWALPVTPASGSWNPLAPNVTYPSTTTFLESGSTLFITDTQTNRLVLKWTEFGFGGSLIADGQTVNFALPSTTSAVLNLVSGGVATNVAGSLTSNGSIFIVNPNGITLTGNAKVTAAGLGLSTATENEFTFLATGTLALGALPSATGDITVAPTGAGIDIQVGNTGNILLAGRRVEVSGDINAGTLTINSNNVAGVTTPGVLLGASAALTVGTAGVAATGTSDVVRGNGVVEINSNGSAVSLSGASATTIRGGRLTVNTTGGAISQGAGLVSIGDGLGDSTQTLTINAGAGTVTLPSLDVTGSGNDRRLDITVTAAGNTVLGVADDVRLMASTINGTLSLSSATEDVQTGGASTVTGTVTLAAATAGKDVAFNAVGDLNFGTITVDTAHASSDIVLTSGGSVTLPSISLGGNLTVTAANNITQQTGTTILQPTLNRRASFNSTSGVITLDNRVGGVPTGAPVNDFNRVTLIGAPGGATVSDLDDLTIHSGTNVVGNATITAQSIILGADAGANITFNGNLTLNATGAGGVTLTNPGAGFTTAPTVTVMDGTTQIGSGTTTLELTPGTIGIVAAGTTYNTAPAVTFSTGGATATTALTLNALPVLATAQGTGYAVGNTFVVSGGGSTAPAIISVATVGAGGEILTTTVTNPGAGFTNLGTVTVSPATVSGTGATFDLAAATGTLSAVNISTLGSFTGTIPVPTVTGSTLAQPTGRIATVTLTEPLTTTAASPTVVFSIIAPTPAAATAAGGGVFDNSNSVKVAGVTDIWAPGPVIIDGGAAGTAIGLAHQFGPVNVLQTVSRTDLTRTAAGVTLYESTTLNLGNIVTGGKLRAYSSGGDVIDSGTLTLGSLLPAGSNAAEFGAGTAAAPGNIIIDTSTNAISGRIAFLDDVALTTNAPANGGSVIGTYLANNVTISSNASITIAPTKSDLTDLGLAGTLTLSSGDDISFAGAVAVNGATTLTATDAITANSDGNVLSTVNVTAGGNVDIRASDEAPLVVNATLTRNAAGTTASFRGDGGLQIGTVVSDYTGLVTFRAHNNNSLTDNVNGMRIFGPVHFQAEQNIVINNAGHTFGLVSASTTNRNGNITIVESGGLRLGSIATNGRGNFTATSTTGDIFQDDDLNGIRLGNGEVGTGTFSAPLGSVLLTDNDRTGNVNAIAITNITAAGNVILNNPRVSQLGQVVLGNITAGGSLTVDAATTHTSPGVQTVVTASASTVNNIEQSSAGRINSFGLTTFVSSGAGVITLGNTGNRFGGVIASTGSGNITITESPTLNLLSILTTGSLVATSETGSIIDTAFTTPAPFVNAISAPTAMFNAPNGNVTLALSTNNFATVGFSTGGNVSVVDNAGNITLAASTIGGTLDVTAASDGNINQSGALSVTGNVTMITRDDTATTPLTGGGIDLSNTANMFGGIRFTAGISGALLAENTTLNLRGGSTSTGPVQLVTNGDFITSGAGASSITNTLTIQAQGTIIPGAGSLLVTGVFTVFSPSLKDLSALSKSGNLLNRDPVNLGSGPYVPPSL